MLAPGDQYFAAMPPVLRARIAVDQAAGDTLQVFIAHVRDPDEPADKSPGPPVLLWNASQGLGTVAVQEDKAAAATLQDIWAADVLEFLTLLFEDPGVEDAPE
jgi:hypothetical protein